MSSLSPVEQMQELEQRLQEAEQRAENAETQVTGRGLRRVCRGGDHCPFLPLPTNSHGPTHHTDEPTGTRKSSSHASELLNKLRCMELSVGVDESLVNVSAGSG